jgi:predicted MFS family arabinose efflux permease
VVGARSYRATLWLTAAGPFVALALALSLVEVTPPPGRGQPWRESLAGYRRLIGGALRFVSRHRLVRWQIAFLGVLAASSLWLLWIYQPYMERCGLPVWLFGVAFALFNLVAALGSQLADRVARRCGERGTLWLLGALQLAPPLLMAELVHPASFLFILGHQAARGLAPPVLSARMMRYTYADKRATVLSIASMAGRLFYAASAVLFGWIAEHGSLRLGLWSQGALLLLLLLALAVAYARIPAKYHAVKDAVLARQ